MPTPLSMRWGNGLLCALACLVAGCASVGVDRTAEVARTSEGARVYVPGVGSAPLTSAAVALRDQLPTVLYLHGCTGIGAGSERWARTLTTAGYAVVMPDSFAREYRRRNCDPTVFRTGVFPEAREMRQEEIKYALGRLRASAWVDQRNLFLMGHSEGGRAVADWSGRGFNAHVISGSRCSAGVWAPRGTPVLAVNFEHDPWAGRSRATCADRFGGRDNARELLLPGSGHDTSRSRDAVNAVVEFLRAHTVR